MNTNYLEAVEIIQITRVNLEKLIIKDNEKSFENERAYRSIKNLLSEFETVIDTINYYSKPSEEGYLTKNINGVFEIEYINGNSKYPLYCGNNIEILINVDGWKAGRIESTPKNNVGYYFYNEEPENYALYNGMKVRLRVNDFTRGFDVEEIENNINAMGIENLNWNRNEILKIKPVKQLVHT
jgi:hypothetical protein